MAFFSPPGLPPTPVLAPPFALSPYESLEPLAEGGMGRIYRAFDPRRKHPVAIKVLKTRSAGDQARFADEIRALSRLSHEGLVRLFDVGSAGDELYFTMELLEGPTLAALLDGARPGADRILWLVAVMVKALDALEHLHDARLVHRDLKPANIMIVRPQARPGSSPPPPLSLAEALQHPAPAVKLLDLGLAGSIDGSLAGPAGAAGTPLYMAPEQIGGGEPDPRADLYSLGALCYHLIAQSPPFPGLAAAAKGGPTRPLLEVNPQCPPAVAALVHDLLSREQERRPPSAAEARDRALACLEPEGRAAAALPRCLAPAFVGRTTELRAIRTAVASAAAGKGSTLHLAGVRGSGKTWLLERSGLRGEAFLEHGLVPLAGCFLPDGTSRDALGELVRGLLRLREEGGGERAAGAGSDPWEAELLAVLGLEPARAAGESGAAAPPVAPDESGPSPRLVRQGMARAAARLLQAAAATRPLLVLLEDIHHADELGTEIIAALSRAAPACRAVLLLTRTLQPDPASVPSRQTGADLEPTAIVLSPLTDADVQTLAASMLHPPGRLSRDLECVLETAADGTPLGVVRAVEELWEGGRLRRERGVWSAAAASPDASAAGALADRLDQLTEPQARTLAALAALATPAGTDELRDVLAAAGFGDVDVRASLRTLVASGLVVPGGDGFRLRADPSSLEDWAARLGRRLGRPAVAAFHRQAAASLLGHGATSAEPLHFRVAAHFEAAGDTAQAQSFYLSAARYLARIYANARSLTAFQKALGLCTDPVARAALEEEVGDLQARRGDYAAALGQYRSALAVRQGAAGLLDKIGRVLHRQGELEAARQTFERCLDLAAGDPAPRAQALFRLGGLLLEKGEHAPARERLEQSLLAFRELGADDAAARVLFSLGVLEKNQDHLESAAARFEESLRAAEGGGKALDVAVTLNNLGNVYRALGEDQKAIASLRRSIAIRESAGDQQGVAICCNNLARVHGFRGDLAASRASTERALELFQALGDRKGVLIARCNLGEVLTFQGELRGAGEVLRQNLEETKALRIQRLQEATLCNLAALDLELGEDERARAQAEESLRTLPLDLPLELRAHLLGIRAAALLRLEAIEEAEVALQEAMGILAELRLKEKLGTLASIQLRLCLARGEPEQAVALGRDLLEREERGMDRLGSAIVRRELGRAYRELGPDWADQTEKELNASIAACERMGSPHQAAAGRVELGLYWQLLGEEGLAAADFEAAGATFRRVGAERRALEVEKLRIRGGA